MHVLPPAAAAALPACLCGVNAVYLVCAVCAAKGCRCQSSQIASAPPLSARMSPTVAESGGGNYQDGAAARRLCVGVRLCIRLVAHSSAEQRPGSFDKYL